MKLMKEIQMLRSWANGEMREHDVAAAVRAVLACIDVVCEIHAKGISPDTYGYCIECQEEEWPCATLKVLGIRP